MGSYHIHIRDRCTTAHLDDTGKKVRCTESVYRIFKVQIIHPNTGRKTWQTWRLCKQHFDEFMKVKGEGWFCRYNNKDRPLCPVVKFTIDEMS